LSAAKVNFTDFDNEWDQMPGDAPAVGPNCHTFRIISYYVDGLGCF